MKYRNLLIYICLLVASLIWISNYGGMLPYLTFFALVWTMVFALFHIAYAYWKIRIFQKADSVKVIKGEETGYHLQLQNEGLISLGSVQLEFYDKTAVLKEDALKQKKYTLLPKSREHYDTTLTCLYSGTYYAGISKVYVRDFWHLFFFSFPTPEKLKMIVKPAIRDWEDLFETRRKPDEKRERYIESGNKTKIEPQVRPYVNGDPMSLIHWKNTARVGELMVRQKSAEELGKTFLIMDGKLVCENGLERLRVVDKLLETNIALVHFYFENQIATEVLLGNKKSYHVETAVEFEEYYEEMAEFEFSGGQSTEIVEELLDNEEGEHELVLFTQDAGEEVIELYLRRKEQIRQMWVYNIVLNTEGLGKVLVDGNLEIIDLPFLERKDETNKGKAHRNWL